MNTSDFLGAASEAAGDPPPEKQVIVQTPFFRCLGFMDRKGQWRMAHDGSPLQQALDWWAID